MKNNIAIFLATSGHSGVDRVAHRLIPEIISRGYEIDLLHVDKHGPYFDDTISGLNIIDLETSHVNSSLFAVARYLKARKPLAMLSDKDRVNRIAVIANWLAATKTRLVLRSGTTLSTDLASRGWLEKKTQTWSVRTFYPSAYHVVTPSTGASNDLMQIGNLSPEKMKTIPSPVISDNLYKLANEEISHRWLGENKQYPVILGVGELGYRKDFETLIRAFALIQQSHPSRLILLGRGKQQNQLQQLCEELEIADIVDFPGFQQNPYPWFRASDAFALTSRWEGMPVVLIEALALGKPCISTDCPSGPNEILQGGTLGPLVDVGDFQALARGLVEILKNPQQPSLLQDAVSKYSVSNSTTLYLRAMGLAEKYQ
jgi:glycosyltransferase involved in cell wall biosynthesis